MAELVLFIIFGIIAIAGALGMVLHPNPVHGALGLMATMLSLAVFYVVNSGHFIAAVQVVVYAGAVMTLFLFVIMMIGVDRSENLEERLPMQRQLAIGLGMAFLVLIALIGGNAWITAPEAAVAPNGTVEAIADLLFTDWLLPFEVTTLLLIIASVGAIALAQYDPRRRREGED
jgi:NADH-quinone oxidoreductase subunit J